MIKEVYTNPDELIAMVCQAGKGGRWGCAITRDSSHENYRLLTKEEEQAFASREEAVARLETILTTVVEAGEQTVRSGGLTLPEGSLVMTQAFVERIIAELKVKNTIHTRLLTEALPAA